MWSNYLLGVTHKGFYFPNPRYLSVDLVTDVNPEINKICEILNFSCYELSVFGPLLQNVIQ